MGKGGQVVGYHYQIDRLDLLSMGPGIDELVAIKVGDEQAWTGSLTDATPTVINRPQLFGGEKREGGIIGAFRLLMGAADQVLPGDSSLLTIATSGPLKSVVVPGVKQMIGVPMGELRNVVALAWRGIVCANSPYPKEWQYRLRRALTGWHDGTAWYPQKAIICLEGDGHYTHLNEGSVQGSPFAAMIVIMFEIFVRFLDRDAARVAAAAPIKAMNPAHIVYQVLTDPRAGGISPDKLDENSFIYAANQLCEERFGLCLLWTRTDSIETFLQVVMDHVGGALYRDRLTGLWTLRLLRDDYNLEDLPLYTYDSGLLSVEDDDTASGEEATNEVRVTGRDPVTNDDFEVIAQHLSAVQDESVGINSEAVTYPGLPTRALALRVAQRDLRAKATGLKRYKLRFDRRAWRVSGTMPIRIHAPDRGIENLVLRVGAVDYGTPDDGTITCSGIEDLFGLPVSSFTASEPGTAPPGPVRVPLPSPANDLVEASYRDVIRRAGTSVAQSLTATSSLVLQLAVAPVPSQPAFQLQTKVDGESSWRTTAHQPCVGWGRSANAIGPADTALVLENDFGIGDAADGVALLLGEGVTGEVVRREAYDSATRTLTIARGCADTVPSSHAALSNVWALDQRGGVDAREYADGETVHSLVLTETSNDVLAAADATEDTLVVAARQARPFPPGNVTVDGTSIYGDPGVHPEPPLAWAHRDRLTQQDQLLDFLEGSVGPEAGTTYRVRVYDPANLTTPLRTVTALAGTTWTYDATMQAADGSPTEVTFRLDAQRDGLDSWQAHQFTVQIDGARLTETYEPRVTEDGVIRVLES